MKKIFFLLFAVITVVGCSDYLAVKPDMSLATIAKPDELRALLDNETMFNSQTVTGEDMSDNYYLLDQTWNASSNDNLRNKYIWKVTENDEVGWNSMYEQVYYANVILEEVEKLKNEDSIDVNEYNEIKGAALFYRSLSFFELISVFALPYQVGSNETNLGVPLRTTSDINVKVPRATIQECYKKIIDDLEFAAELLPTNVTSAIRPSKLAAWGLMARVALDVSDYERAFRFSEKVIDKNRLLLDFSQIDSNSAMPFTMFNREVIHFTYRSSSFLAQSRAIVDSVLYQTYDNDDLRRACFFSKNSQGNIIFKGSYTENLSTQFTGLTTAEMYLTFVEAGIRINKHDMTKDAFSEFLKSRYKTVALPNIQVTNAELLKLVLKERRKELIFRNRRWGDIKRFNLEGANIVLKRHLNNQEYTLMPKSLEYALLIPLEVLRYAGIVQNRR